MYNNNCTRQKNKFLNYVTKSGKVQETNKLVPLKIEQNKSRRFYEVLQKILQIYLWLDY